MASQGPGTVKSFTNVFLLDPCSSSLWKVPLLLLFHCYSCPWGPLPPQSAEEIQSSGSGWPRRQQVHVTQGCVMLEPVHHLFLLSFLAFLLAFILSFILPSTWTHLSLGTESSWSHPHELQWSGQYERRKFQFGGGGGGDGAEWRHSKCVKLSMTQSWTASFWEAGEGREEWQVA